jgi:hypothetical protein
MHIYAHAYTNTCIYFTDFLHGQHVTDGVHATSAVFRLYHHAHKSKVGKFFYLFFGKDLFFISFNDAGKAIVLCKISGRLANHEMFF